MILPIFGLILVVLGILFLRREKRLFTDSVITTARLYDYYTSRAMNGGTMYTMEVEYPIADGTVVRTRGQSSSNRIKYPVGTEFKVWYSAEKPELFIICGDKTSKYILYGMIVAGVLILGVSAYMYFNGMM